MQRQLEMLSAIHLSSDPTGLDFEGFSYADHEGPYYILLHGGIILKICSAVLGHDGADKAYQHVGHPMTFLTESHMV